ncbi:UNVERIFIED_CONTAM: hypothetical protein PYX00_010331 [Menopon gallinae]|uniref:Uncharacterized protein n=1 Tax=Menopon gallinae TaxID=328185 RepID=A0AAW2HF07_9NEOP
MGVSLKSSKSQAFPLTLSPEAGHGPEMLSRDLCRKDLSISQESRCIRGPKKLYLENLLDSSRTCSNPEAWTSSIAAGNTNESSHPTEDKRR